MPKHKTKIAHSKGMSPKNVRICYKLYNIYINCGS